MTDRTPPRQNYHQHLHHPLSLNQTILSQKQQSRPRTIQKAKSVSDHLLQTQIQTNPSTQPLLQQQSQLPSCPPETFKQRPSRPKLLRGKSESAKADNLVEQTGNEINQLLASGILPPKRCANCGRVKNNNEDETAGSGSHSGQKTGSSSATGGNAVKDTPINCTAGGQVGGAGTGTVTGCAGIGGNGPEDVGINGGNPDLKKVITLWQNYYPEGHWGWIIVTSAFFVQCIAHGSQLSYSVLSMSIKSKFLQSDPLLLGILGPLSLSTSLLLSPVWVSLCKRKSTRLVGIFGGLIAALAYLFTSFASQFHQLFISYGILLGIGAGCSRDAASLMVGGYFKKRRDFVEIIVVAASGVGIIFMSAATHGGIIQLGWRIGLQAITGCVLFLFFLGIFYRSPSLYHPQRRAILHLKNQRRKVKEKYKKEDKLPFFDWTCLKSMTLRILFGSSALLSFGIYVPLFFMHQKCHEVNLDQGTCASLHFYLGGAWIVGCLVFGFIVVQQKDGCTISKQYLCQGGGTLCGLSMFMLMFARDSNSLVMFSCVNGFALGAYNYTLKVYTLDRARARHFPRAWSYLQFSQSLPILSGAILSAYVINMGRLNTALTIVTLAIFAGVAILFFANVRRRSLASQGKPTESFKANRKDLLASRNSALAYVLGRDDQDHDLGRCHKDGNDLQASFDSSMLSKNLVSISEEGLGEIDFQEIYFEDFEEIFGADAITSCNKVENCIASEADAEQLMDGVTTWDAQKSCPRKYSQRRNSTATAEHFQNRNNYIQYQPQRQFHTIAGIGKPTIGVLSGVVAMNTLGAGPHRKSSLCVSTKHRSKLKNIQENQAVSGTTPSPNSTTAPSPYPPLSSYAVEMNNLSTIPSYESLQRKSRNSQKRY